MRERRRDSLWSKRFERITIDYFRILQDKLIYNIRMWSSISNQLAIANKFKTVQWEWRHTEKSPRINKASSTNFLRHCICNDINRGMATTYHLYKPSPSCTQLNRQFQNNVTIFCYYCHDLSPRILHLCCLFHLRTYSHHHHPNYHCQIFPLIALSLAKVAMPSPHLSSHWLHFLDLY